MYIGSSPPPPPNALSNSSLLSQDFDRLIDSWQETCGQIKTYSNKKKTQNNGDFRSRQMSCHTTSFLFHRKGARPHTLYNTVAHGQILATWKEVWWWIKRMAEIFDFNMKRKQVCKRKGNEKSKENLHAPVILLFLRNLCFPKHVRKEKKVNLTKQNNRNTLIPECSASKFSF